ncbi:NTP transferase domain-containing protein [Haloechinothrix aidingensis]
MTVAGLLLAAGAGTRFGGPKALAVLDGRPLVEHGTALLRDAGCAPIHVVLGAAAERVRAVADLGGTQPVTNEDWADGLASSLRAGLRSLPSDVDAVLITLVDQPLIDVEALRRLRAAHAGGAVVAAARYQGVTRNPVLLDRSVWPGVAEHAHGDSGARGFLRANPTLVTAVDCDDAGTPFDVDTADDLAEVRRMHGASTRHGHGTVTPMARVESTMLTLGTHAPDFALPDPSGKIWSLDAVAGQHGTLVAFLCNHCPFVAHIAVPFGQAAARWIDSGVSVIGINSNDTDTHPEDGPEKMVEFATEWNWTFPYVSDPTQSVAHAYRAACTPDFFLFDSGRRLVYRGRFDAATPGNDEPVTGAELDSAVTALLRGAPLDPEQRPSIGCNIKWKPGNEPSWSG